jgi:outer membrane immunogenic protein
MLRRTAGIFFCALACVMVVSAQDVNRFDASVAFGAQFSRASNSFGNTVTLKPTDSGVLLLTIRHRFSLRHGVSVNISHTANAQVYKVPPDTFRVQSAITEYSGTYSFTPFQTARMEPFLFAGVGILRFNRGNTYIDGFQNSFGASTQNKLAFPYGVGLDYKVWKALAVRVQYRGLVFKSPNFGAATLVTGVTGHMAVPTAGIVIKF